jgi:hypothetical protein
MRSMAIRLGLAAALLTGATAFAGANPNPGGEAVHRLGSDPLQLRFEGETSARSWPIYVTAGEAGARARVHLGFTNAISVMPEVSILSLSVNDVPVAQVPIAAATDPGALDVELPRGLLTPGFNNVRISVLQRHRVDCSMEATYELWTQLDPATSGLAFPGLAYPYIDVLDDLAAVSPDPSGAVDIRVVLPRDADATAVDNAMRAAEAVAIRADAARPRVEVVDRVADGAGLYVVAGERAALAAQGLGEFLAPGQTRTPVIAGQDVPGRIVVVAAGDSQKEIDEAIDGILPVRPAEERADNPAAARALANQFGYAVGDSLRVPLSDLGVKTEEFSGRLYRAAFDIRMPGDFYPADYDKLTLSLTAGYAAGLAPNAQILVRVNDREAGSMPMKSPRGDLFRDRPVSVSLGALRPGVNHVVVEAQTPDAGDSACDVKHIMDMRKRFVLFERSELIVPPFARIGRLPDLAATLSNGFPYQSASDSLVYAPSRDRLTLSGLGTYLARTAVSARRPLGARITFDRQAARNGSALFVGAFEDFPRELIEDMGVDYQSLRKTWSRPNAGDLSLEEPGGSAPSAALDPGQVYDQWAQGSHAAPEDFSPRLTLRALYDRYINIHRRNFALLRAAERPIEAPERSTILIAQARNPQGFGAWTLVAGASRATLARDMTNLVAPSNWNEVEGRAAAFTPRGGARSVGYAEHTYFIPTDSLTPGNLRLIAAGFLSANLDYYVLAVLAAAALLGLATYAAVKAHGNRP